MFNTMLPLYLVKVDREKVIEKPHQPQTWINPLTDQSESEQDSFSRKAHTHGGLYLVQASTGQFTS